MRETSQPVVNKVAIIGAGPGGLATAIALRKKGIDAHVYERAKELRPVGAGLGLQANGLRCLDVIQPGIVDILKRSGCQVKRVTVKTSTGETIRTSESTMMEKYGQPLLIIWWWRLQQILASYLPPEVIHLNHRCISFEQNENTVITHFDNGKTAQADLLIGADGVNSRVRQTLIGDGQPRYVGSMSWRAVLNYQDELLPLNEVILMKGEQSIVYLLNVGEGNMSWLARKLLPDSTLSSTFAEVKSRVLREFANWMEPVRELIAQTDPERILEGPICDRPPLKQWSHGRVTLLGDAAHPMTPAAGQGANTTFEDAYELAECLYNFPDLQTALNNYDNRRIQRTAIIQTRSAEGEKRYYQPTKQINQQSQQGFDDFRHWVYDYEPKSESRLRLWQETVAL
ncbi:MAG: NAD(P)-binding protein [Okeania sp. SIO2G4]|uniref:FAD-dependent oxidoreductase n=1 Tax=unclassified Okeania TaxID=2634635 RepID=UPI0013BA1C50|nr:MULTISPECIES: FAD-dependent monooxygenase [unclassified Okeania]NEP75281.1 NAD(P)-binding protein [Okeania sp. SIO2G5]NEP96365.1 NAD(P)-binding protein [Okeania sp. SIO2F5]NEQ94145.1 NAD(P)-binding protein [Okeania sp. SIO2G4]